MEQELEDSTSEKNPDAQFSQEVALGVL